MNPGTGPRLDPDQCQGQMVIPYSPLFVEDKKSIETQHYRLKEYIVKWREPNQWETEENTPGNDPIGSP